LDKKWLRDFVQLYDKEELPLFTCDGRADILDEEIIRMISDAGCYCLRFGIESGNESIRRDVLKKNITNDQIISAAHMAKRYGLKFLTYNMVGIPGETIEDAFQTVELNIKIKTDFPRCSILTPYPGTKIAEKAKEDGLLDTDPNKILASAQQYQSIVKSRYKEQLLNIHSFFQTAVIFPWTWKFIKKLIKFPPNFLFRTWWAVVYFFVFFRSEGRTFGYTVIFALHALKTVFEKEE
jgi:anaerobic magnesium-protoporphyrin IX monomethyl ester cyclase